MSDRMTRTHSIERTSPKGGPFMGTCTLCGQTGLTFSDESECPNQRGLSQDEALLEAIEGPAALRDGGK